MPYCSACSLQYCSEMTDGKNGSVAPAWHSRLHSIFLFGLAFLTLQARGMTSPLMKGVGFTWLALFYATILLFVLTRPDSMLTKASPNEVALLAWHACLRYLPISSASTISVVRAYLGTRYGDKRRVGTFLATLAAVALTLFLAVLSWRYFEQPLIRMGRRSNFEFGAARRWKRLPQE